MAGTDRSKQNTISGETRGPIVILVEPQLGENIGMAARAMLNCALTELRLVAPRDGWPNEDAEAASAGAVAVIENASVFDTLEDAVADLSLVLATTARERDMTKIAYTAEGAATALQAAISKGARTGVLFGRESKGLTNDHVALADAIVHIPMNPGFSSLNLAQAVFCIAYEFMKLSDSTPGDQLMWPNHTHPATKADLFGLFEHLEKELDACGFLRVKEKRPTMVRNIRNIFQRAQLTEQEVRTLRGVVAGLVRPSSGPRNDG